MTAHDQAAAVADGDGSPRALFLDNGREELDSDGRCAVWVHRVGQQLGRINQGIMPQWTLRLTRQPAACQSCRRRRDMRRLRTCGSVPSTVFSPSSKRSPASFTFAGRVRQDMENLLKLCEADWSVIETKAGDYRYRICVRRSPRSAKC